MMKAVPALLSAARLGLGGLFAYSGYLKLLQPVENFTASVRAFQVLPMEATAPAAAVLPWIELILGVFLAAGLWTRASLSGLWALNTAFVLALASAILRKLPMEECGCFGEQFSLPLPQMLALDLALWVLFLLLWRCLKAAGTYGLDRWTEKG